MPQCESPLNIQFEVTYRCDNRCVFCYNKGFNAQAKELGTEAAKKVIRNVKDSGILSLNFNGGEPLMRSDFFDIAAYAKSLGLDIHLNTNASLIDDVCAEKLATLFPAVCTTILSDSSIIHDKLSGRSGALYDAMGGIKRLQEHGVYVTVNLMVCDWNADDTETTFEFILENQIKTLLVTRYVPNVVSQNRLHISDERFFEVIRRLTSYQKVHHNFERIALPQPIRLCSAPADLVNVISEWNIPCNIGLCTASIDAYGEVTPCNLVKKPVLGNALDDSLSDIWKRFDGEAYCREEHLSSNCCSCEYLSRCGGGCKGFRSALCL